MRLSEKEINAIKETIYEFDNNARSYLFGSRTQDNLKGGDIDLLIISSILTFRDKLRIKYKLFEKIGEQKIDIVISNNMDNSFVKIIYPDGIPLNG